MNTEEVITAIFAGIVMYVLIGYVVLLIWGVSHSNDRIDDNMGYLTAALWPVTVPIFLTLAICDFCKDNIPDWFKRRCKKAFFWATILARPLTIGKRIARLFKAKENKRWK